MVLRASVDAGAGGTLVTSVTGTANQITVTPTTGAAVASLPSGIITPGSLKTTTTLWQGGRNATYLNPADPTLTSSTTPVMCGLGSTWALTPSFSGRLKIIVSGYLFSNVTSDVGIVGAYYGTGTAPSNGAAASGTIIGHTIQSSIGAANFSTPFALYGEATGLTLATAYWFDLQQSVTSGGGGLAVRSLTVLVEEF